MHCKQQEQLTNIVGFSGLQNTGVLALSSFDSCTKRRLEDAHTKIKWGMSQGQLLLTIFRLLVRKLLLKFTVFKSFLQPTQLQWNGNMRYGNHPGSNHSTVQIQRNGNMRYGNHPSYKFNLYMHCLFNNNYTPPGSGMELEADLTSLHIVPSVS